MRFAFVDVRLLFSSPQYSGEPRASICVFGALVDSGRGENHLFFFFNMINAIVMVYPG